MVFIFVSFFPSFCKLLVPCFSSEDIKAEFDNFAESSEVESDESEVETKCSQKKTLKSEGKKVAKKRRKMLTRHGPVKSGHGKSKRASTCLCIINKRTKTE